MQAGVNGKSGPVLPVEQWSLLVVPPPLALPSTSPSGPIICADLPGSCPHPPPLPPTPTLPSLTLPDRLLLLSVAKHWPDHRSCFTNLSQVHGAKSLYNDKHNYKCIYMHKNKGYFSFEYFTRFYFIFVLYLI